MTKEQLLPILLPSSRKHSDGFLQQQEEIDLDEDGREIRLAEHQEEVIVLPTAAINDLMKNNLRQPLRTKFGTISPKDHVRLIAGLTLVQAINTNSVTSLDQYKKLLLAVDLEEFKKLPDSLVGVNKRRTPSHKELAGHTKMLEDQLDRRLKNPLTEASEILNTGLSKVRIVLWWHRKQTRLFPGLFCPDYLTAMQTLLFSQLASTSNLALCERCGSKFVRTRKTQNFCSLRCGNAARQAEFRLKG